MRRGFFGKHSEETKRKISEARKGQIPWNKGKYLSEEIRKKMSEAKKGKMPKNIKILTNWTKKFEGKTYEEIYGKEKAEKIKEKVSKNNAKIWLGKKRPEIGNKISERLKGKPKSEKHKFNLSRAKLGKPTNKRMGLGWRKYDLPLLRETDWAYIAGILDGEGSIFLEEKENKWGKRNQLVHLSIANTDLDMLEWIKNKLNTGAIHILKPTSLTKKQCYKWQTGSHKVVCAILIKMLPYLKIKRDKAIKIISFVQNKEIKT